MKPQKIHTHWFLASLVFQNHFDFLGFNTTNFSITHQFLEVYGCETHGVLLVGQVDVVIGRERFGAAIPDMRYVVGSELIKLTNHELPNETTKNTH